MIAALSKSFSLLKVNLRMSISKYRTRKLIIAVFLILALLPCPVYAATQEAGTLTLPTLIVTAEPIQIPADGTSTSTITATVSDEDGNPVADGTKVRFTTDEGSFIGGALTIDKETVDGIATAELKSILSAETVIATITAEANGSKGATSVFFIEDGGTEIIDRKTEITALGEYTVDARSEADTEVTKSGDGTPIVTVAKYKSNPGGTIPSGFAATGEYIDVHLDTTEDVDQIEIKNYYTAAQVAGIDESSLRMRWWNGESWVQCSDGGVNTNDVNGYSGYVWAIITASTTPNLTDLSGAVFGGMGTPPPEDDGDEGGGGGGGVTPGYWVVIIDNLGKITEARVSPSGELLESVRASDAEGQIALELDRGTKILCPGGKVPQRLEIRTIQISPPQDTVVLDGVYRLDAYLYEYSQTPSLFTISPPGKLALSYDLSDLPPNSLSVFSAYYDAQKGWVELSPGDITEAGELAVEISGPVIFTIMVKLGPPPLPGEPCFRPSNLVIEPGEAKQGQEISISLIVTNIGGAAGTCTLELKVDGEARSVKRVTLEPGESEVVSFSIIEDMEGEHMVEIADLEGDFTIVIISRPWWPLSTATILPVAIVLERRRRWKQRVEWSTGLKTKDWLVK